MEIDNTHVYDVPEVLAMLDDIVSQFPDDHTARCIYFNDDGPVCIVGQVLHRIGVTLEDLGGPQSDATFMTLCEYSPLVAGRFTQDARVLLDRVQYRQDESETWREALAYGRERFDF